MKKLNRILFSLIAPQIDKNAECKMQNAELDEKTLAAVFALAKKHDLGHLVAGAVENAKCRMQNAKCDIEKSDTVGGDALGAPISAELMAELEKAQMTAVWRVRNIENEQGRVKKCLEEAKIPFIMLKGAVVRDYYPESWMRTSSDIDVLVPRDAFDNAIRACVDGLEYRISTTEPSDASLYSRSGVHLDMHTLFEGDGAECSLLNAAWAKSSTKGTCEHFLTPEHFYFYHIAHMAEHVRNGGCGIRPFIDLYLINAHLDVDRDSLNGLLVERGLDRFEAAAIGLSEAWMSGSDSGELGAFESYILSGGVYGSVQQGVAAKRRDGQSRLSYLMGRIFMPYSELKKRHRALDGRPWLTPFFEVYRWCSLAVPSRLRRSGAELKSVTRVDSDSINSVKGLFDSLGL